MTSRPAALLPGPHATATRTRAPRRSARITAQSVPSCASSGSATQRGTSFEPAAAGPSGCPSARSLRTTTRRSTCGSEPTRPRARLTAPSRSVLRSPGVSAAIASRAARRSVVAASATRAGAPASTTATASPSRIDARSSRAPRRARSKRVSPPAVARMLIESSTTRAIATDAPPERWSDSREQRTNGVAPRTASPRTARARVARSARSSSRERRRAFSGEGATRCAGGNGRSCAWSLRRRCARYGATTKRATASAKRGQERHAQAVARSAARAPGPRISSGRRCGGPLRAGGRAPRSSAMRRVLAWLALVLVLVPAGARAVRRRLPRARPCPGAARAWARA